MRVMVTGSRDWRNRDVIGGALYELWDQDAPELAQMVLVHGCATGADAIARSWADGWGWSIEDFWPNYMFYSVEEAPKKRNIAMVESEPDVVLAFPTKRSRGTWHAVNAAKKAGVEVRIFGESP
jgi:hypothetical protein